MGGKDVRFITQSALTKSAEEKAVYILQNPVRRGLVENTEDWPFQGEIFRAERLW
jgi:hypothetical protein